MTYIVGKSNITVTVICDSVNANNVRMTTLECEYPRFILSEVNTHRMLSKNTASSRAIPTQRMRELVESQPAKPVSWPQNQSGMTAKQDLDITSATMCEQLWNAAAKAALQYHEHLSSLNLHKQITNRLLEPWQMVKSVISGTEWTNLLWLRDHSDAQPEFAELARCIRSALTYNQPTQLFVDEWHLPYVDAKRNSLGVLEYYSNGEQLPLELARMVSASCCAQVSYRRNDSSVAKAQQIFYKLIESEPPHCSPVEHQATPLPQSKDWPSGVTHLDSTGNMWSGNLRDWIQFRKLLPNEARW